MNHYESPPEGRFSLTPPTLTSPDPSWTAPVAPPSFAPTSPWGRLVPSGSNDTSLLGWFNEQKWYALLGCVWSSPHEFLDVPTKFWTELDFKSTKTIGFRQENAEFPNTNWDAYHRKKIMGSANQTQNQHGNWIKYVVAKKWNWINKHRCCKHRSKNDAKQHTHQDRMVGTEFEFVDRAPKK